MANDALDRARVANPAALAQNISGTVPKVQPVELVVFFIGGAGDKESYYRQGPFGNIREVKDYFDPLVQDLETCGVYRSFYLGYNEVCGEADVQKYIIPYVHSNSVSVYIVGHSLGAWNGAHLSRILSSRGYSVDMLITLDPVGEGTLVWLGSNIYRQKPMPQAKFWINLRAKPSARDSSDAVADFGEQWNVGSGPDISLNVLNVNHYNAKQMFILPLQQGKSAADFLHQSIRKAIQE